MTGELGREPPRVEGEYYEPHMRIVRVHDGDRVLHSVDTYRLLPAKPPQADCAKSDRVGVELCYVQLNGCTAVVVVAPGRVELVNYRVLADRPLTAREILEKCDREADRLEEVLRSSQRGQGQ